jgi:bifunctional pyridoxal-dependent enzyme with beta-cystathionase and maltose regulon repressor activities
VKKKNTRNKTRNKIRKKDNHEIMKIDLQNPEKHINATEEIRRIMWSKMKNTWLKVWKNDKLKRVKERCTELKKDN